MRYTLQTRARRRSGRPKDVDCVTEIVTRGQYYKFEAELEKLGFRHAAEGNSPICRWKYRGLTADIMPTEGAVLDFRSAWYPDGYANAQSAALPGRLKIRIFTLPYFLASKIEAFLDRGRGDFLASPDMEDIITVLDGAENAAVEISRATAKVRKYLAGKFSQFLKDERFVESLEGNLRSPSGTTGRIERIKTMLTSFK